MNKKPACKINDIGYPSADKITSRISTLRRSMACTMMNRDACTPEQEALWLQFFPDNKCAYCGQPATHLDHLHPMIRDNEPTGYGTDPGNLVPCCKNCNTPKGNKDWEQFMRSVKCVQTAGANKTAEEAMEERIENIKEFQKVMPAKFKDIDKNTKDTWRKQWIALEEKLKETEKMMLDMKRQLFGNNAIGNQATPASSMGTKPTNAGQKARKASASKYTDADKYIEAACYLRQGESLIVIESTCLGVNNKGSTAKMHLNSLGIDTSRNSPHKGMLSTISIDDAIGNATDAVLKHTLEEIKARGLHLKP